jgi:hypothetical protein
MKLKGAWVGDTTYDVGDVVRYSNGDVCILQKPCAAGVTPLETKFWGKADDTTTAIVNIAMDAIELTKGMIPTNIDSSSISLTTETGEYIITVDDSGDTPELVVTADTSGT